MNGNRSTLCAALLTGLAVLLLGGCGFGYGASTNPRDQFPPPSAKTLDAMERAPFPVYWLGRHFHGMALSSAEIDSEQAIVRYGPLGRCDWFDGCGAPPLSIFSRPHTEDPFLPPSRHSKRVCWRHLRGAAVLTCHESNEFFLYSGRGEIGVMFEVEPLTSSEVINALRPLNPVAGSSRLLPPPAPLECRQFRGVVRWFVVFAQRHFGPRHCARYPLYSKTR